MAFATLGPFRHYGRVDIRAVVKLGNIRAVVTLELDDITIVVTLLHHGDIIAVVKLELR